MTEPSIEEIVARIEAGLISYPIEQYDIRALIASWRERGDALLQVRAYAPVGLQSRINAALATEPAGGEAKDELQSSLRSENANTMKLELNEYETLHEPPQQEWMWTIVLGGGCRVDGESGFVTEAEARSHGEAMLRNHREDAAPPPPPTQGEEETARAIVRHHANRNSNRLTFPLSFDDLIVEIAAALRQARDEATKAEREACALVADDYAQDGDVAALDIAAAIRARQP